MAEQLDQCAWREEPSLHTGRTYKWQSSDSGYWLTWSEFTLTRQGTNRRWKALRKAHEELWAEANGLLSDLKLLARDLREARSRVVELLDDLTVMGTVPDRPCLYLP